MYSSVKTNRTKQNKKLRVIMLQVNMLKIGKKKKKEQGNIFNMPATYSFEGMTDESSCLQY